MNPPSGYYRKLLENHCSEVRIAFTHTPIYGCKVINSQSILNILDKSDDPYATFYSNGLRNGLLVAIVESQVNRVYKNNGELFFTT